jgi:hypothetical protein
MRARGFALLKGLRPASMSIFEFGQSLGQKFHVIYRRLAAPLAMAFFIPRGIRIQPP